MIEQVIADDSTQIVVVDCTFTAKNDCHTHGLNWFYNGKTQRAERGLEWSVVAIVDLTQKTGYALSAQRTEAGLSAQVPAAVDESQPSKSQVDFYLGYLAYCTTYFSARIRYVVADGFYSKYKWVTGVVQLGFHAIGQAAQQCR
ncbi:IS4 family transposase, partial [filamentous cyanobacterium CCP4]